MRKFRPLLEETAWLGPGFEQCVLRNTLAGSETRFLCAGHNKKGAMPPSSESVSSPLCGAQSPDPSACYIKIWSPPPCTSPPAPALSKPPVLPSKVVCRLSENMGFCELCEQRRPCGAQSPGPSGCGIRIWSPPPCTSPPAPAPSKPPVLPSKVVCRLSENMGFCEQMRAAGLGACDELIFAPGSLLRAARFFKNPLWRASRCA